MEPSAKRRFCPQCGTNVRALGRVADAKGFCRNNAASSHPRRDNCREHIVRFDAETGLRLEPSVDGQERNA